MCLFKGRIQNWDDWSKVYMDVELFRPLIEYIAKKHAIEYEEIIPQGFSTNAVFKVGKYIIKLFAPPSSGANTVSDYTAESSAIARALVEGVLVPKLLYRGLIESTYPFYYMVFQYIEGFEARKILKNYTIDEKADFVKQIKTMLKAINQKPFETDFSQNIKTRYNMMQKWHRFNVIIQEQVKTMIATLDLGEQVYVHGDITGDNIIIDVYHQAYLIDFADSTIAPYYYEYPSIIFDLFNFDKTLIHLLIKNTDFNTFIEVLYKGTLLHEFGAHFVERILKIDGTYTPETLPDIRFIKTMLKSLLHQNSSTE